MISYGNKIYISSMKWTDLVFKPFKILTRCMPIRSFKCEPLFFIRYIFRIFWKFTSWNVIISLSLGLIGWFGASRLLLLIIIYYFNLLIYAFNLLISRTKEPFLSVHTREFSKRIYLICQLRMIMQSICYASNLVLTGANM